MNSVRFKETLLALDALLQGNGAILLPDGLLVGGRNVPDLKIDFAELKAYLETSVNRKTGVRP